MLDFLQKLKNFAIKSLIIGCIALVVTTVLGSLLFNLSSTTTFMWFLEAFLLYFAILFAVALFGFIAWYMTPTFAILVLALGALLLVIYVFVTKSSPMMTYNEFVEMLKAQKMESFLDLVKNIDKFFSFLQKPVAYLI